jgi:3-hydroxyacyl-CoA dehydrogenase
VADDADLIEPANYEEHLKLLKGCDLVIEAIAERMDWKSDLYTRSPPRGQARHPGVQHLGPVDHQAVRGAARASAPRFCGIHFFNPPRYMHLVELIATPHHRARVLDQLEAFVTSGWARAWCAPRTRPTSSPTASASPACWRR